MRVVIVGKTKMRGGICIGGIVEKDGSPVRLIPPGESCNPQKTSFEIGQVWEMDLVQKTNLRAPHLEDREFRNEKKVGRIQDLEAWILSTVKPWKGDRTVLFDGKLHFRSTGSAYLPDQKGLPQYSTGFWVLPVDLHYDPYEDAQKTTHRYCFIGSSSLIVTYVGVDEPKKRIPAKSLVRLSLARWWQRPNAPEEGSVCSLQLSGWF